MDIGAINTWFSNLFFFFFSMAEGQTQLEIELAAAEFKFRQLDTTGSLTLWVSPLRACSHTQPRALPPSNFLWKARPALRPLRTRPCWPRWCPRNRQLQQVLKLADWTWAQFYEGATLKPAERGRLASKLLRHHDQASKRERYLLLACTYSCSFSILIMGQRAGWRWAGHKSWPVRLSQLVSGMCSTSISEVCIDAFWLKFPSIAKIQVLYTCASVDASETKHWRNSGSLCILDASACT